MYFPYDVRNEVLSASILCMFYTHFVIEITNALLEFFSNIQSIVTKPYNLIV